MLLELYIAFVFIIILGFFIQRFSSNYMIPALLFVLCLLGLWISLFSPPEIVTATTSSFTYNGSQVLSVTTEFVSSEPTILQTAFALIFISCAFVNVILWATSSSAEQKITQRVE